MNPHAQFVPEQLRGLVFDFVKLSGLHYRRHREAIRSNLGIAAAEVLRSPRCEGQRIGRF
jgi:hypothetical protein